ncbi:MAG TPA: methyltransferase domain-containing protein [Pyrinomonadaceae bacterium]|jgi:ubiquinone/menaquinone biosynthesis C-methylase UbiE|nr:methyltransferase domain-containing protein [Pyrinomonadaceae bacterium]
MNEPEQSEIATAYDDWAETYDEVPNRTRDLAAEAFKQIELDLKGRKVVEVGCGTGRNTVWLAERAAEVVGIDFSAAMLRRARARVNDRRVRFVQHDISAAWPLAAASADVVVAMLILEHVEHLEPVFAEAAQVLNGSGRFLLCELHPIRQLAGGQAQFSNNRTGEHQCVTAFLHYVSDYLNVGLASGFELQQMGEWCDADAPSSSDPRVLSLLLRKR